MHRTDILLVVWIVGTVAVFRWWIRKERAKDNDKQSGTD